jgi:hypothetical protein
MIADTLITDPSTGEVLAAPDQALDAGRLEVDVGLRRAAEAAARAVGATHRDAFDPLQFWRKSQYRIEIAVYGLGPLVWQLDNRDYVPEWAEAM